MSHGKANSQALAQRAGELTGHTFKDTERLERALTHSSARNANKSNYERLEFLGDRVLGLVIAEMLFTAFPKADEGELSVRLNQLVDATTCAEVAEEIGLHELIRTGSEIKSLAGRKRQSLRADVMESVIATIYLDGGMEAARPFIEKHWQSRALAKTAGRRDAKTELQEWAHQKIGAPPLYSILDRSGPDHDPVFSVRVEVEGFVSQEAKGPSKREAERLAAEKMLIAEKVWQSEGAAS
ncbi:ribonuclease III [Notoacmeibacter sp. MSK16QG-6]|uniref:ribonuclease III n=1 Tax=Notoacmeibacter sp. MSK16QG-6 TaxID=2957982 RepID=UPI00209D08D4|nr:ribonuclease III [Notoacmeibacter sp. MSK16QG-6]MCP1198031.1 ribonuclease III [Notoacmeibacter sp. MSK16QG-6]